MKITKYKNLSDNHLEIEVIRRRLILDSVSEDHISLSENGKVLYVKYEDWPYEPPGYCCNWKYTGILLDLILNLSEDVQINMASGYLDVFYNNDWFRWEGVDIKRAITECYLVLEDFR